MLSRRAALVFVAAACVLGSAPLTASGVRPAPVTGTANRAGSYAWHVTATPSDDEFRGLAAVSRRTAWVSGEDGTVLRTTNHGRWWRDSSPAAAAGLALRDIEAWDALHAVVLSIGTGTDSRIYSTDDGGRTWMLRFRNQNSDAFYDCMAFSQHGRGLALSDPVNGHFRLAASNDFGRSWHVQSTRGMPAARAGEFAFAASGTCIVADNDGGFWFVSGGVATPRVFHSTDGGRHWNVRPAPLRGGPSAGVYSVDFRSAARGVMVGGDYADETNGADASAYLDDATHTWIHSERSVLGYRSGVAFVPHVHFAAIAVGPTGSDVTFDDGNSWTHFDGARYDAVACTSRGPACWASGTDGRVAYLK